MDFQRIIDICKIIGLIILVISTIVSLIAGWAYFENKEVKKIESEIEESRRVKNEDDISQVKEGLVNIKDDVVEEVLRRVLDERRQISINYGDLSKEEQDQILRDRFNLGSEEIEDLIKKAIKRTESYLSQAMGYELKYDYKNAIKFYEKALEEAASYKDKAWVLYSLGNRYLDINNYLKATNKYDEALSFYDKEQIKSDEDLVIIGNIYSCLGIIERNKANNYIGSIKLHENAVEIRKQLVSKDYDEYAFELSKSYNDIAVAYKHSGDLDKSIDYNEKAIKIRKELISKSDSITTRFYITRSLNNLGNVYFSKGEILKAKQEDHLKYYHKSKSKIKEAIDLILSLKGKINEVAYDENLASYYINYGRILHATGDYKNSIEPLKLAIISFKILIQINEEKYIQPYIKAMMNLARTYRDIGEIEESVKMFENTIEEQTKIVKNRKTPGDSEIDLADIYFNLGLVYLQNKPNKELALLNFKKSYILYEKYPKSNHASMWKKEAKKKLDSLNDL